jgi:type II secretory pathway component PulF
MTHSADAQELISFCHIISTALKSGRPLPDSLLSLSDRDNNSQAHQWCNSIGRRLAEGYSLKDAVQELAGFDPVLARLLPLMGQGRLVQILDAYTNYLTIVETLNKKLQAAMFYPFVILMLMVFNLLHLNFYLFPGALRDLAETQTEPGVLMRLLYFANYEFWPVSLLLPLVFSGALFMFARPFFTKIRHGGSLLEKIFGMHKVLVWQNAARAQAVIGLYLKSGFSLEKAIRMAAELTADQTNQGLEDAAAAIERGLSVQDAFGQSEVLKNSGYVQDSTMDLPDALLRSATGNHRMSAALLERINEIAGVIALLLAGFFVLCVTSGFFDTYYYLLVTY